MEATNCNHNMAKCVETTEPKAEGRFKEKYVCQCGAVGFITGREEHPPSSWERFGEVFE